MTRLQLISRPWSWVMPCSDSNNQRRPSQPIPGWGLATAPQLVLLRLKGSQRLLQLGNCRFEQFIALGFLQCFHQR